MPDKCISSATSRTPQRGLKISADTARRATVDLSPTVTKRQSLVAGKSDVGRANLGRSGHPIGRTAHLE
jgi:hypothetical protein